MCEFKNNRNLSLAGSVYPDPPTVAAKPVVVPLNVTVSTSTWNELPTVPPTSAGSTPSTSVFLYPSPPLTRVTLVTAPVVLAIGALSVPAAVEALPPVRDKVGVEAYPTPVSCTTILSKCLPTIAAAVAVVVIVSAGFAIISIVTSLYPNPPSSTVIPVRAPPDTVAVAAALNPVFDVILTVGTLLYPTPPTMIPIDLT